MAAAALRFRRVLAVVVHLATSGPISVADLASRFGRTEAQMEADLTVAGMIMPSQWPGAGGVEIVRYDDGRVEATVPPTLARPQRFSRGEGLAVLAAGQALLAVEPDGMPALRSALAKLEAALQAEGALVVDVADHRWRDPLERAASAGERVEIRYWSLNRDAESVRRIDPLAVYIADGNWYTRAHDHRRDQELVFRLDRILEVVPTGERFDPRPPEGPRTAYTAGAEAEEVRLRIPAGAGWVLEAYDVTDVEVRADGGHDLTLQVSGTAWLERLLLRLGPDAEVLEPDALGGLAAAAARRLLARYA